MPSVFDIELVTPEKIVFSGPAQKLSVPGVAGSLGILANHAPLLAMLDPAELRLHRSEGGDVVRFAQAEGYLQVAHDGSVLLLVEEAREADSLNTSELQERLQQAERELQDAGEDTERRRVAERDQRRWETFLRIAEGG